MSGRYIVYVRVSTERQGRSGLGLQAQEDAVASYIAANGGTVLATFQDIESGKRNDRPGLAKAIARARITNACLLIAKMDRLSRNAAFLMSLKESACEFKAVDNPHADRFTVGLLALLAEREREQISERTKAALQAAKRRGIVLGCPAGVSRFNGSARIGAERSAAVRTAKANERAADLAETFAELHAAGHITASAKARQLNAMGIFTPRGKPWQATQVIAAMARIA